MHQPDIFSIVLLLIFLGLTLWGVYLWRFPESVASESLMYRWIYYWLIAWTREKPLEQPKLTERGIRIYAVIVICIGLFGLLLSGSMVFK